VVKCWETSVCPTTRQPRFTSQEKHQIAKYLSGHTLVFHHAKFDIRALSKIGIHFEFRDDKWVTDDTGSWLKEGLGFLVSCPTFHDTLLASHATSSSDEHNLKSLAIKYLRYGDDDEQELKKAVAEATRKAKSTGLEVSLGKDPTGKRQTGYDYWLPRLVDPKNDTCLKYAGKDTERTILLWRFYEELMEELGVREQYEKERQLMPVVYRMETKGITYHKQRAVKKIKELKTRETFHEEQAARWARRISEQPEFNVNSSKQMKYLLYEVLELDPPHQTKTGQNSTDAKAMEKLLEATSRPKSPDYHPPTAKFLKNVMLSRKYGKATESLISYQSYGIPDADYPSHIKLYPNLNQTGAQNTTRFSSSNPNGQNISKVATIDVAGQELVGPRVRDIFSPLPGDIWYAIDYSQLELRIFASVSQEKSLIQALDDGYDFHEYVAMRIFKKPKDQITKQERRIAKNTNFAIIFGASPFRVNLTAGISNAYEMFAGLFPNVHDFMQDMIAQAKRDRFTTTVDGYRLDVPADAPYKVVSYKVQGTAGRIIKNAMVKIHQQGLVDWINSCLRLQIHDELIVSFSKDHRSHTPLAVYKVMQAMEQAGRDMGITTPVSCERIESNWGQGEEVLVTPRSIRPKPKKVA